MWAFVAHAALLAAVARFGHVPLGFVARRLVIELPFIAFAFFLPIVGVAPRVDVLGLSLSEPGLWAAWNIIVKGTLGVAAAVVMAATTPVPQILTGLERLRTPPMLVGVMSFMIRYGDVVSGEMHRMKVARQSRGYNPRWIWQVKALTQSTGALFIRSYERGERVFLAMEARGYAGSMPSHESSTPRSQWAASAALPALAAAVSYVAWMAQ